MNKSETRDCELFKQLPIQKNICQCHINSFEWNAFGPQKKSCSINRFYAFKCYLPIHACNERDNLLDLLQNDDYLLKIGRGHLVIFHPWNKCVDKRLLIELKNSFVSWTIYFLGFVLVNIILQKYEIFYVS